MPDFNINLKAQSNVEQEANKGVSSLQKLQQKAGDLAQGISGLTAVSANWKKAMDGDAQAAQGLAVGVTVAVQALSKMGPIMLAITAVAAAVLVSWKSIADRFKTAADRAKEAKDSMERLGLIASKLDLATDKIKAEDDALKDMTRSIMAAAKAYGALEKAKSSALSSRQDVGIAALKTGLAKLDTDPTATPLQRKYMESAYTYSISVAEAAQATRNLEANWDLSLAEDADKREVAYAAKIAYENALAVRSTLDANAYMELQNLYAQTGSTQPDIGPEDMRSAHGLTMPQKYNLVKNLPPDAQKLALGIFEQTEKGYADVKALGVRAEEAQADATLSGKLQIERHNQYMNEKSKVLAELATERATALARDNEIRAIMGEAPVNAGQIENVAEANKNLNEVLARSADQTTTFMDMGRFQRLGKWDKLNKLPGPGGLSAGEKTGLLNAALSAAGIDINGNPTGAAAAAAAADKDPFAGHHLGIINREPGPIRMGEGQDHQLGLINRAAGPIRMGDRGRLDASSRIKEITGGTRMDMGLSDYFSFRHKESRLVRDPVDVIADNTKRTADNTEEIKKNLGGLK